MRDALLSIALGAALCFAIERSPAPEPSPECPEHAFMCCRTFVEEPDCKDGALTCRPGFETCEVEDYTPPMAKRKTAKTAAPTKLGQKGRPLSTIRLVLDAKSTGGLLAFLSTLTPTQRERVTEIQTTTGGFRVVLETPSSETRDIDEAIRALPGAAQAMVVHGSKIAVTA